MIDLFAKNLGPFRIQN